ncbi:membrane protein insertase YidC [Salipaludibacillus sp. HK11]|uniref:membrane protein insertase YidC n=1 Tax=Salipaludibacillus sp. HK11 TaxID=3394320 RepID=UPI0039FD797B
MTNSPTNTRLLFIRLRLPFLLILITFLLAGCGINTEPIDVNTPGFFNHYIVYPFSFLIKYFASIFNDSFGVSIIIMTILLRTVLMPLMLKQTKNQMFMREKMSVIQPEMESLKNQYKDKKSKEDQQSMQKEILALYQKHQYNPINSIGCLPVLIQFPFLIGFYYAIMRTPEIANSSFLWFNLGERDVILPLIAAGVYSLQFQLSQRTMQQSAIAGQGIDMQKQMKVIGYLLPIMMGVFSFAVAAALPLYWTVGGLFLIFQSQLGKKLYRPKNPILHPISELNDPQPEGGTISDDVVAELASGEEKAENTNHEEKKIIESSHENSDKEELNEEEDERFLFFPECLEKNQSKRKKSESDGS